MNLQEHKRMLREYEHALWELKTLKTMSPHDEWSLTVHVFGATIPIPMPSDTAEALLDEHIITIEQRVKEMAAALGITPDEICQ